MTDAIAVKSLVAFWICDAGPALSMASQSSCDFYWLREDFRNDSAN
jgi:hypothetical protein